MTEEQEVGIRELCLELKDIDYHEFARKLISQDPEGNEMAGKLGGLLLRLMRVIEPGVLQQLDIKN